MVIKMLKCKIENLMTSHFSILLDKANYAGIVIAKWVRSITLFEDVLSTESHTRGGAALFF